MAGRDTDYTWQSAQLANSMLAGSAFITELTAGGLGTAATLFRIRGECGASIDSPSDGDKTVLTLGIIRATPEQVAVGVTAFPTPGSDGDADWIWYGSIPLWSQAANSEHTVAGRLKMDSKAMRKFRQGETLVLVGELTTLSGTPAADVVVGVRFLFGT